MDGRNNDGDLPQDFGKKLPWHQRNAIKRIKNNDPGCKYTPFELAFNRSGHFTSDSEWKILGRYIAQNEYLQDINMSIKTFFSDRSYALTDSAMSSFFGELNRSAQLRSIKLLGCACSMAGYRSMAPFLNNSPQLKTLTFGWNDCINKPCFDELMELLNGKSIESLEFDKCWKLDDISAFEQCALPHLKVLNMDGCMIQRIPSLNQFTNLKRLSLSQNNIDDEGCTSIAEMLQNNSPPLEYVNMTSNPIGDEGVEILANSLQNNTTLKTLSLSGEGTMLTVRAYVAFLKVLNDVTSINSTCQSNHTLNDLYLPLTTPLKANTKEMQFKDHVTSALTLNELGRNEAIRKKVIETQLNSKTRMKLCTLQGIHYCQSSIFAEIEPIILPEALSLVGGTFGHNELYQMLLAVVPGLVSVVDREAVLKQRRAENLARIKALSRKVSVIESENERIEDELGDIESNKVQIQNKLSGKKRCR